MPSENISPPIILALHKVRRGRRWDHTNIQPGRLSRIFQAVVSKGYRFTSLSECLSIKDPSSIAVTFDDGYAHLVDTLTELCVRFNFRSTLFIPSGTIGKTNRWDYSSIFASETHLTPTEIRKLSESGFDIGSHGWSHRALTSLSHDQVRSELFDSKKLLEDISGHAVESISYPFGRVNNSVSEMALEAGYRYGLTTGWPIETQSNLTLGRIMIYGFDTPFTVLQKLHGRLQWLERTKQNVTTALASGTVLFQRLSRRG